MRDRVFWTAFGRGVLLAWEQIFRWGATVFSVLTTPWATEAFGKMEGSLLVIAGVGISLGLANVCEREAGRAPWAPEEGQGQR